MGVIQSKALQDNLKQLEFLKLSYVGGSAYKDGEDVNEQDVLIKTKREKEIEDSQDSTVGFETRKRMAVYRPYYRSIIDRISGYVLGGEVVRDKNLDAVKTNVQDAMQDCVSYGLPLGEYWVGVDAPMITTKPLTKLQEQELSADPYFITINPINVVDLEYNDENALRRFVYITSYTKKPSLFEAEVVVYRWYEWTTEEIRVYEAEENTDAINQTPVATYRNPFDVVPFVQFCPDVPVADLAEICKHLFNLGSLYDEELTRSVFTSWLVAGVSRDDVLGRNPVTGEVQGSRDTGEMLFAGDTNSKVHRIAGEPASAENLLNAIYADIDELYRIVGLRNTYKNQVESGEAKRLDFQNLNALLVRISQEAERVENALLPLLGDYERSKWPDEFNVRTLQEMLEEYREEMKILYLPTSYIKQRAKEMIKTIRTGQENEEFVMDVDEAALLDKERLEGYLMVEDNLSDKKKNEIIGVSGNDYVSTPAEPVHLHEAAELTEDMENGEANTES